MAVLVDAWHQLAIQAADWDEGRTDLVVVTEQPPPVGDREVRVIAGTPGGGRPAVPSGFVAIAAISVRRGVSAVAHCHIADP
jgi:hypothetical protein